MWWWASPLNVPLLLPGNSSGESLLSRVSAESADASVAELFDRLSEGSSARFAPPSVPTDILSRGKMNKLSSSVKVVFVCVKRKLWAQSCRGEKKRSCHPGRIPAVMANELRPNVDFSLEEKLLFDDIRHWQCSVCRFKPFSQIIIRDDITEAIFPKDGPAGGILRAELFSHIWVDLWRDLGATGGCTHKHTQKKNTRFLSFRRIWSVSLRLSQQLASARLHSELSEVCKYLVSNYLLFSVRNSALIPTWRSW